MNQNIDRIEIKKRRIEALKKNIFYSTKAIYLELSNICNFTYRHPMCPTSQMKEKTVMSLDTREKILKEMGKWNYDRLFQPHMYSEPLIDPRLYKVLELFNRYCPKGSVSLVTNGFFLYPTILKDLIKFKVSRLLVSIYSPEEMNRLLPLIKQAEKDYLTCRFEIRTRYPFNKRMADMYSIYERDAVNLDKACLAPYRCLYINSNADVISCCYDWKFIQKFGSLKNQSLEEILLSDKMVDFNLDMVEKKREKYFVCSRCLKHK